jgi:hypothetical protein
MKPESSDTDRLDSDTHGNDSLEVPAGQRGCTDSMVSVPTWKDLTVQASRIRSMTKRVRAAIPTVPQSIPPYLAFRCIEIDLSTFSPGVYLLLRDNAVVYVGSSIAVINRIGSHRQGFERKDFHRAVYIPCREDELLEIEGTLIRFFEPEYNSVTLAPFTNNDAAIRRMFQLPEMHPELRKLYRAKLKLKKMSAARKAATRAANPETT